MPRPQLPPALVLAVAILAVSSAAVLVRLAGDTHPIAVALWRTELVAALLAPSLAGAPRPSRRDLLFTAGAGLLLAVHFWSWFASLHLTSVLHSTLLVCLNPVWAGILEWRVLKTPPPRRFWAGIALAVAGVGAMGGPAEGGSWQGDALATLGGLVGAGYLLVGRAVRRRVGIGAYGALVSGACAAWLLPLALLTGARVWGFSASTWLALVGLALGPQLLGHIGLNYAIRYVPAAAVAGQLLLEPVGATALGAVVLEELPGWREVAGAVVVLAGVLVATLPARRTGSQVVRSG